jgi:hypothetical protein
MRLHVVEIPHLVPARIAQGHADDLGVRALLVFHPEDPDRPGPHPAAGEDRFLQQHQGVQRVAVLGQRVRDEAIVGWVDRRREQPPVQMQHMPFVVELVLVAAAPGDLDDHLDRQGAQVLVGLGRRGLRRDRLAHSGQLGDSFGRYPRPQPGQQPGEHFLAVAQAVHDKQLVAAAEPVQQRPGLLVVQGQSACDGVFGVVCAPAHRAAARPAGPRLEPAGLCHAVDPAAARAHPAGQQPGLRHLERDVDDHGAVQRAVGRHAREGLGLRHGPGKPVQDEAAAADVRRGQTLGHQGHYEVVVDQSAAFHGFPGPPGRRGIGPDRFAEDVTYRDVRYDEQPGELQALGSLSRTLAPQHHRAQAEHHRRHGVRPVRCLMDHGSLTCPGRR